MSVRNTGMTKTAEEAVQSHTPVFLRSTRLKLQPGDRILLENNSVFAGQFLQITDSGTKVYRL